MKHSALHLAVLAAIGDKEGQLTLLSGAFATDFGHYVRSNNRADVESALLATGKSAKGKAIAMAIAAGFKSGALVQGYIGARLGKYASQSPAVQQPFEDALIRGCEAFEESLKASEAFKATTPRTEEEKAAAKDAKAEKAAEAKALILNEAVRDGTMVRASSVVEGQTMSYTGMVNMVIAGLAHASHDNLSALFSAVSLRWVTQGEQDRLAALAIEDAAQAPARAADAQARGRAEQATLVEEAQWAQAKTEQAQWAQAKSKARLRDAQARALATEDIARQMAAAVAVGADGETIGVSTVEKKPRGNRGRVHTLTLKAQQRSIADATAMVAVE